MSGRRARIVRASTPDYRSHTAPEILAIADRKHDGLLRLVWGGRERIVVAPRLTSLEADLAELERTDPDVAAASAALDQAGADIVRRAGGEPS